MIIVCTTGYLLWTDKDMAFLSNFVSGNYNLCRVDLMGTAFCHGMSTITIKKEIPNNNTIVYHFTQLLLLVS